MVTKEKPKCPESKQSWYDGTRLCQVDNEICLLESGSPCPSYEEWLLDETLSLQEDDGEL